MNAFCVNNYSDMKMKKKIRFVASIYMYFFLSSYIYIPQKRDYINRINDKKKAAWYYVFYKQFSENNNRDRCVTGL
jgi:hypothetical protein